MDLTTGELATLRNLLAKSQGESVAFVSIADASALTGYGLAVRTPQGWAITDAGRAHLEAEGKEAGSPGEYGNVLRGPGSS